MLGTKEIAAILEVEPVTVRKYARALEAAGYIFERSDGKNREYNDTDVTAFQDLVALCKRSGISIENGAIMVVSKHIKESQVQDSVSSVTVVPVNEGIQRYDEMVNVIKELISRNEQQTEKIDQQAEKIERLHTRMDGQNANISQVLREITETRRMVAAMNEKKMVAILEKRFIPS